MPTVKLSFQVLAIFDNDVINNHVLILNRRATGCIEQIIKEINAKEDEIKALEKDKLDLEISIP